MQKLSRLTFEVEQLSGEISASAEAEKPVPDSRNTSAMSYTQMIEQV
jgi:hypothetical protein